MSDGTLKINSFSSLVMVNIQLWNKKKNAYSDFSITVDTGASVTTISNDILIRAGYDVSKGQTKKITTASGTEFVKEITVDKIQLDNIVLDNVIVYAHTFPQESFSTGVLGLNILADFDVNFLFSKGVIELTKI